MNTRLQVEHPITEMVTGVDLVDWQLRIADGESLDLQPDAALNPRGHAIECRVYAEDPDAGFLPSPGRISGLHTPDGPWIRDDRAAEVGAEVSIYYDPLISKLAAWGGDRMQALARMQRALREYRVLGIRTTVPFFRWMLDQPGFRAGDFHTGYLDELLQQREGQSFVVPDADEEDAAAIAAALHLAAARAAGVGAAVGRDPLTAGGRATEPPMQTLPVPGRGWRRHARLEGLRA
jgi:acetyl-CoA carboxylase biotin carboxylase subunit